MHSLEHSAAALQAQASLQNSVLLATASDWGNEQVRWLPGARDKTNAPKMSFMSFSFGGLRWWLSKIAMPRPSRNIVYKWAIQKLFLKPRGMSTDLRELALTAGRIWSFGAGMCSTSCHQRGVYYAGRVKMENNFFCETVEISQSN